MRPITLVFLSLAACGDPKQVSDTDPDGSPDPTDDTTHSAAVELTMPEEGTYSDELVGLEENTCGPTVGTEAAPPTEPPFIMLSTSPVSVDHQAFDEFEVVFGGPARFTCVVEGGVTTCGGYTIPGDLAFEVAVEDFVLLPERGFTLTERVHMTCTLPDCAGTPAADCTVAVAERFE